MKVFKITDIIIQVFLIVAGVIYATISIIRSQLSPFDPYIIIAAWQIISCSIHYFFLPPTIFQHYRLNYGRIVLVILILGFVLLITLLLEVSIAVPSALLYLTTLMILFPFLAIFYLIICWKEYRIMIKRELIHLK